MRKALNENPVVQVVMLGVLGIVMAVVFMTRLSGGSEAEPAPEASSPAAAPTTAGAAPAPTAITTPAAGGVTPVAPPADSAAPATGAVKGFKAGDGLPKPMVEAYNDGDVVVLLVQQKNGIEDKELRAEVNSLSSRSDTSIFVAESKRVADYSRIAEGVDLDRIPALIVIHPKSKGAKSAIPQASVSYGFRGQQSVEQAVRDALYDGKQLPYHPG